MAVLIVVDVQHDFCPGGSLAVREGNEIVPLINQLRWGYEKVVFTQDWHPANHASFAVNHPGKNVGDVIELGGLPQILWPVHCVQSSLGASFHSNLIVRSSDAVFRKGTDPAIDSYSAFYDNARRKSTGLAEYLHAAQVREVALCGLATDYCVKFSALDALSEGFKVTVLAKACRGVDLKPGDSKKALDELRKKGATIVE